MSTIQDLAREWGMQEYELRAFSGDLLDRYETPTEEIDPEIEQTIREAMAQSRAITES
jgi:polyhydroxyalkanoate synthesis regulator phasin